MVETVGMNSLSRKWVHWNVLGIFCMVCALCEGQRVLLDENFEEDLESGLAKVLLNHRHVDWVKGGGRDGSDGIRVSYVGYDLGSERIVLRVPLGISVTEATLVFDVLFEEGFQWTLGGKLHGLGPQRPVTGGRDRRSDGWSARMMFNPDGVCGSYLYDQNKERLYGVGGKSRKDVFVPGKWHRIVFQMALNDLGETNGFARVLIDGVQVVYTPEIAFRGETGEHTEISQLLFSTFHGGGSPRYAPVDEDGNYTTVYARFDNIKIMEGIVE